MDNSKISKTLAYALRHRPDEFGLHLDEAGWVSVDNLLQALNHKGVTLGPDRLQQIVEQDSKQRYSMREGKIRANQGHSIEVQAVELLPLVPPALLYHGTTLQRWSKIQSSGCLHKGQRHHVHLSSDIAIAREVAGRWKGEKPVVLAVAAAEMHKNGIPFFRSENGVWLTDSVPVQFLEVFS